MPWRRARGAAGAPDGWSGPRAWGLLLVCAVVWGGPGCGYRMGGIGCEESLQDLRSLGVPLFANASMEPRAENAFTAALRREMQGRAGLTLAPEGSAEGLLVGKVARVETFPVAVNEEGLVLQFGMRAAVFLELVRRGGGETLWRAGPIEEETRYYASSDPMIDRDNRAEALQRLAGRIAERALDRLCLG